jgi:hypothetical protein
VGTVSRYLDGSRNPFALAIAFGLVVTGCASGTKASQATEPATSASTPTQQASALATAPARVTDAPPTPASSIAVATPSTTPVPTPTPDTYKPGQKPVLSLVAERKSASDGSWAEVFDYPVVSGVRPEVAVSVNKDIKAYVDAHRELERMATYNGAQCPPVRPEAVDTIKYRVAYVSANLLSLVFDYTQEACDAGDGGPFQANALNFRLDTGKQLAPSDVFRNPKAAWDKIDFAAPYLLAAGNNQDCVDSWDGGPRDKQWWATWSIRTTGIEIDLDESDVSAQSCQFITFVVEWLAFDDQQPSTGLVAHDLGLPKPKPTLNPSLDDGAVGG